jgi:tetraacyldisaccharide 4'-kinase
MGLPLPIRVLLRCLSWLYGGVVRLKALLYERHILAQKKLKAPVVSVGNLSVGGTGKTPMVLWLAEKFLAEGKRVAILTRGYRGRHGSSDEVELMKNKLGDRVLFGVEADRYAAGHALESQHRIDVFLLDDGFQHLKLARDVDIVLIDSTRPAHKDFLLPAGRLREPLSAVRRATAVFLTRAHQTPAVLDSLPGFPNLPIFSTTTRLVRVRPAVDFSLLKAELPQPVFAFCGIGNPRAFFDDVIRWGIRIAGKADFPDHHGYSEPDIRELNEAAERSKAKAMLTTEKDVQNLSGAKFTLPFYCCEIALEIADEDKFSSLIQMSLSAAVGASA